MDNTKTVYAYTADGKLLGAKILDHTDRSPISGRWQIPAQCTEITPPNKIDGYDIIWAGSCWDYKAIPPQEDEPTEPDNTPTVEDTAFVSPDTIETAETVIDLYDQIDGLNLRLINLEGDK